MSRVQNKIAIVTGALSGLGSAIARCLVTEGAVVVITDVLSSMGSLVPTPNNMAYGASKAAVRHLTTSVAMHCAKDGSKVRCNSIHPGVVKTPMLERLTRGRAKASDICYEQLMKEYQSHIPQAEFQTPEDIAYAVLFLASDEAKHITGIQLIVDGGITMGR